MPNDHQNLIDFVLTKSMQEPGLVRASLYRALADFCGNEAAASRLTALARELEQTDEHCRQVMFEFSERHHQPTTPVKGARR